MKKQLLLLSLFCLTLCSCSTDDSEEKMLLRINHYQQTAVGLGPTLVYLVQQDGLVGTAQWSTLYDEIAGFEYEPGHIYDLLVTREFIGHTLTEGSSVRYGLEKIIRKEKVAPGTPFEITLKSVAMSDPPQFVTGSAEAGFMILNRIPVNCQNFCDQLEQVLETEDEVTGIFKHGEAAEGIELLELKIH